MYIAFVRVMYNCCFNWIQNEAEREWFAKTYEDTISSELGPETKKVIASEMLRSQAFDKFMATKFATVKRYGAEGAETMMGFFHEIFRLASQGIHFYQIIYYS